MSFVLNTLISIIFIVYNLKGYLIGGATQLINLSHGSNVLYLKVT